MIMVTVDALMVLADVLRKSVGEQCDDRELSELDGMDSLAMVRLMLRIENIVGRELAEDELEAIVTIGDLKRLLAEAHGHE